VLRAAGETETTQENIQDWLQLDEGDPGFQLLTGRNCCSDTFFLFSSALMLLNFPFICFLYFLSFRAIFCFVNPVYRLTLTTSIPIDPD
jgi:hypothetical protein